MATKVVKHDIFPFPNSSNHLVKRGFGWQFVVLDPVGVTSLSTNNMRLKIKYVS